jgi:DNA polymerase bacteriophage-type
MPILYRDIEARSTLDLKAVGVARYAADITTDVWLVGFAVDDGPVQLWHPGEPVPQTFIEAAGNPEWIVVAHNDAFERAIEEHILAPRYGWPLVPIERHRCTMAMALACALPGGLDKAAATLNLPMRKDADGKRLMQLMAKPRKGGGWHDEPEKLARLGEYCKIDVEIGCALYHRLPQLSDAEQALWQLDAKINARGFFVDTPLLEAAARIAADVGQAMQREFAELTGGLTASQVEKVRAWLADRGCDVDDLQKATLKAALLRKGIDPVARRAIQLRLSSAQATTAKVNTMLAWCNADNRIRHTLQYHRAATGRWAGRGPQPQNFRRDPGDIDAKIARITAGDLSGDAALEIVGDIARGAICAAPGRRLMKGDFSGVESRVLAWLAGEQTKLDQWREFDRTGDPQDEPYWLQGKAFGLLDETARPIGKTSDLAFGYQGGVSAWDKLAPEGDPSIEADKIRYRDAWRERHEQTCKFWRRIESAAISAVWHPGKRFNVRGSVSTAMASSSSSRCRRAASFAIRSRASK